MNANKHQTIRALIAEIERNIAELKRIFPDDDSEDIKARVDARPKPKRGEMATCSQCGGTIYYVGPYWSHASGHPRHPAIPVEYAI